MNILIIGSGGREHALAWTIGKSKNASKVFVAPGNAGTYLEKNIENVDIDVSDIKKLISFAQNNNVTLTIVGPEIPLSLGIVDEFEKSGLKCLGPKKQAAQLESSKAYSKNFMKKYNIPTSEYEIFKDLKEAILYLESKKFPIVIKASGLAAGKGVVIAENLNVASKTVADMLCGNSFGDAGSEVVIEEFLAGEEASFIVICDGDTALPMATSQDHKTLNSGDKGPNTGGMGAYSPATIVTPEIHNKVMKTIINPVLEGMKKEGVPYTGFLYAGLMIDKFGDIKTLEYNCRFGDPETQPIIMRLESDFLNLCLLAVNKKLKNHRLKWSNKTALGVVLASNGYPGKYLKGDVVTGLNSHDEIENKIFHSGTVIKNDEIKTNGGRVCCAVALGKNIENAFNNAYDLVDKISWKNKFSRNDIGFKEIKRFKA